MFKRGIKKENVQKHKRIKQKWKLFFCEKNRKKGQTSKNTSICKKGPTKKVHRQKIAEVPNTCFEKRSQTGKHKKEKENKCYRNEKEREETTDEQMDEHKEDMKR